ncbi:secretion protein EspA [Vibrio sp. Of14-4]|uniref:Secretion protein EspA n=1 Tax=Vibrio tetraodonis subsp. pristinus TaxID=2695891 RepID=A0A6L8LZC2_9VIBR|nr:MULTISPECIES: secretion protein EspA [Vibrio]MCG7490148.1 secretion protein EspA [Vibrio sp. Of14-4]MYM58562.1 secretion protein EspA [Vibrio tetraodonis subsp. pristinus]
MSEYISSNTGPSIHEVNGPKNDYTSESKDGGFFSFGIATLYDFMSTVFALGQQKFEEMQLKSRVTRDAQEMANRVDEKIAEAAKEGDKATRQLPEDVINYMKQNGFKVSGKSIDQYLQENGPNLDQGKLQAVKAALETVSNRASDFVTQAQLKIQKLTQNANMITSLISSLQTMIKQLCDTIFQGIR